jgi:hypothetical protein
VALLPNHRSDREQPGLKSAASNSAERRSVASATVAEQGKAVCVLVGGLVGLRSHRRGHWFDPSIAHIDI